MRYGTHLTTFLLWSEFISLHQACCKIDVWRLYLGSSEVIPSACNLEVRRQFLAKRRWTFCARTSCTRVNAIVFLWGKPEYLSNNKRITYERQCKNHHAPGFGIHTWKTSVTMRYGTHLTGLRVPKIVKIFLFYLTLFNKYCVDVLSITVYNTKCWVAHWNSCGL